MALQRRTLLHFATGLGAGLAGCSTMRGTDGTNTDTPTESGPANPRATKILVVVHNHLPRPIAAAVELTTEQRILVDEAATFEPNGVTSLETGIDETGHYHLTVALEDRKKEIAFEVDDYDLEMGSNVVFWIDEDEIRYGIED